MKIIKLYFVVTFKIPINFNHLIYFKELLNSKDEMFYD